MKLAAPFIATCIIVLCSYMLIHKTKPSQVYFTEKEVLALLDLAFKGIPNSYYPNGGKDDIKYNFFLDLEHGYCVTAGSRIHLYADDKRWAIVFEKSGYQNRGTSAEIELDYIGNCIEYPVDRYPDRNYITNAHNIVLITPEEYERITNIDGDEIEQFEMISSKAKEVTVRGKKINIEHNPALYIKFGIKPKEEYNPKHLIGYEDLIRYLHETKPELVNATDEDIKTHIPKDLPKLMTIDKFHFESVYDKDRLPRTQETYQLLAKVLVSRNPTLWKPILHPNNHWSNWESGNL